MKINHGNLEKMGWRNSSSANSFYKNGMCVWLWERWALQTIPKSSNEHAETICQHVKSIEHLNELISSA